MNQYRTRQIIGILLFFCSHFMYAQLTINEWMADNATGLTDEAGEFDDWFEIHNSGDQAVDLLGYYLSDDSTVPDKFQIGTSIVLEPDGFALFWADNDLDQGNQHVNFKLGSAGEEILISDAGLNPVHQVTFTAQATDISTGAFPNGSSIFYTFTAPTPGTLNIDNGSLAGLVKPIFDVSGGFFESTQSLELSHPAAGANIYYTLDGDAPDENDLLYTSPISINETTVVRAIAREGTGPISQIATNVYFINENFSLPTISIVTDPDDMFGSENGIYANPEEEGKEWERFTQVQYFESNELKFEIDAGIRIQGSSSVTLPKKSFRLFFDAAYGEKWLKYDLFEGNDVKEFRNLVLRSGYDDDLGNNQGTLLRDPYGSFKFDQSGGFVSDGKWAILTINGEYWGIYDVRESVNDHFIESHTGEKDFDQIRFSKFGPEVKEGSIDEWEVFTDFITSNDLADPAKYAQVEELIDIDDFINFLAFIHHNSYDSWTWGASAFKAYSPGSKWKFTIWDLDRSLGSQWYFGFEVYSDHSGILWANFIPDAFMANEEFRFKLFNRLADQLNTNFTAAQTLAEFADMKNQILAEIPKELELWSDYDLAEWEDNLWKIEDYLGERGEIIRDQVVDEYSASAINTLVLDKTGAGNIALNTLYLENFPWTGSYFTGVPIELTALPDPGSVFLEWSDNSLPQESQISIDFSNTKNLTAHFGLGNTELHNIVINEINYNSADSIDAGDWIELYNAGAQSADLSGWYLQDASGDYFSLPAGTTLAADAYLVLAQDLELFSSQYPLVNNVIGSFGNQDPKSFGLSNSGELLHMNNADISFFDAVEYNDKAPWPTAADGEGPSLQLLAVDLDNALPGNWSATNPTPGTENFATIKAPQQIDFTSIDDHYALDAPFDINATSNSGLEVELTLISGPASLSNNTITLDGIAGTVIIEANQAGDSDYFPATAVQQSFAVLKESQSISIAAISDQLPSAAPIPIAAQSSAGLQIDLELIAGPASLAGNTLTLDGVVGTVQVKASQPGNQTYQAATDKIISFEVYQLQQEIMITQVPDKFTLDDDFMISATVDSPLPLSYEILSGPASIIGNVISLDGVQGEVLLRIYQSGNIDYTAEEKVVNFDVLLSSQVIDFEAIDNHLQSDLPFEINATSSSALPITFEIIDGPATISGNLITLTGAIGNVEVLAVQEGNETYAYAESSQTFGVSETPLLDQQIQWTAIPDKLTIDAPFDLMAEASSGLPISFEIISGPASITGNTITLDGVAGTVSVQASQSGNQDYYPVQSEIISFEVLRQDQEITWTAISDKLTIDTPFEIFADATSGLPVNYFIMSGPASINANVITLDGIEGTVTVVAEQIGNDDYNASLQYEVSFEVKKQQQLIVWTAIPDKYTFDVPFEILAEATSGLSISYSIASGPATINDNVITLDGTPGVVILAANQSGDEDFYEAQTANTSFTVIEVMPANQQITFVSIDDQFTDAAPITLEATASSGLPISFTLISGPATLAGNILTLDGLVGEVVVAANQPGDNFYLPANEVTQSFAVKLVSRVTDLNQEQFFIAYPNPAKSILNLSTEGFTLDQITIYNSLGKIVKHLPTVQEQSQLAIPIDELANGYYLLSGMTSSGKQIITNFIKA